MIEETNDKTTHTKVSVRQSGLPAAMFLLCVTLLILGFCGDPDLVGAAISHIHAECR